MSAEFMPDWAQELFEGIVSGIEFKGFANMEGRHFEADETSWGVDLLEIAPAVMNLSQFGGNAEEGYGSIHSFDLLAAQEAFDEVESLSFGIENDGHPCITMGGKVNERDVVVLVYVEPFDDSSGDA